MRLPSLTYLTHQAATSFKRFPLTVISALVAAVMGICLNEIDDIGNNFPYINTMLCSGLGISLFFCVDVYADTKSLATIRRRLLEAGVIIVLVILYFTLPGSDSTQNTFLPYIRYGIYSITAHLLVAIIPFLGPDSINGFWNYNKALFIRVVLCAIYSGCLYGGLALALGSLDFLFDVKVHNELFLDLFIVISTVFNTWFFIAGIPKDFKALDDDHDYSNGIRIFAQYILLSLLVLYLVILYIYAGKIIILWSWPKGVVPYLIACVGVLGILTLLLIYPYGTLSGNTWIKKFSRIYYFILIPLVALLFIAIGMRVSDYGVTINRYVIILLGIWLTIVCIYFGVGRTNIKFIPVSLAVILVLMSFGPWGIFSFSETSQIRRLEAILSQNNILKDGKVQHEVLWNTDSLPELFVKGPENTNDKLLIDSLHNEVKSILDYLDDHHGFVRIQKWYIQNLDSFSRVKNKYNNVFNKKDRYRTVNEPELYMRSLGLRYVHLDGDKDSYFSYSTSNSSSDDQTIVVTGYDELEDFSINYYQYAKKRESKFSFNSGQTLWVAHYGMMRGDRITLSSVDETLIFRIDSLVDKLIENYGKESKEKIPFSNMTLYSNGKNVSAKMELTSLSFNYSSDTLKVNNVRGHILLRRKK